jgi:septation ring formation regulator EzrA
MQDVASKKESEKKLESLAKELESLRAQSEADEKEHKLAQQHLQEVNAGLMRNEDGAYASLNDQLMGISPTCI